MSVSCRSLSLAVQTNVHSYLSRIKNYIWENIFSWYFQLNDFNLLSWMRIRWKQKSSSYQPTKCNGMAFGSSFRLKLNSAKLRWLTKVSFDAKKNSRNNLNILPVFDSRIWPTHNVWFVLTRKRILFLIWIMWLNSVKMSDNGHCLVILCPLIFLCGFYFCFK